jgi:hypothetical protein
VINISRTSFLYQTLSKILSRLRKSIINFYMTIKTLVRANFKYKANFISIIRHYLYLRKKGFKADEAMQFGILDPNADQEMQKRQLSQAKLNQITLALNPIKFRYLLDNKVVFYKHCQLNNIVIPKVYAIFIKKKSGYKHDNTLLSTKNEWMDFIDNETPDSFVIKPALGLQGKGILFLSKKNGDFFDQDGSRLTAESIYDYLATNKLFDLFIFQEKLIPHHDLATLSDTDAIQTVRLISYIDSNNNFQVLHSFFKVICGNNRIDNLCGGRLGNLCAILNSKEGKIDYCYRMLEQHNGFQIVDNHPNSGLPFKDFKLPYWDEALKLIENASRVFLPLRSVGWDIAMTDSGPIVVEGNYNYGVVRGMGPLPEKIKN